MAEETSRTCVECQGTMCPIVVMDKVTSVLQQRHAAGLEYRAADDKVSFWTGNYPTAGQVRAFLCQGCGRISLYGGGAEE